MVSYDYGTLHRPVADSSVSVPQDAWIHSGTIRDNITFSAASEDIDPVRLKAVIVACGLESDVLGMPNGLL
jgi:ABC-type multidrug transport system fused ATPase/permease subunit